MPGTDTIYCARSNEATGVVLPCGRKKRARRSGLLTAALLTVAQWQSAWLLPMKSSVQFRPVGPTSSPQDPDYVSFQGLSIPCLSEAA